MSKKAAIAIASVGLAAAALLAPMGSLQEPPLFKIAWPRGCPASGTYTNSDGQVGDYTNVFTVVIRTRDVSMPTILWDEVFVTSGTNYSEPRTNDQAFFAIYNMDVVTGKKSDLGGSAQ